MTKSMQVAVWSVVLLAAGWAGTGGARVHAQEPGPGVRARAGQRQPGLAVAEVERLFDGYVAMQAQDALKLTDAQFPRFLAKLRVLQQARRLHLQERRQLVADLGAALRGTPVPEARLGEDLRKLRELDARHAEDVQKAYEGVDQVLDVAQQARFRVFEDSVERRKFDLLMRARRSAQQGGGADRPTGR
jgi:hypothetical protein